MKTKHLIVDTAAFVKYVPLWEYGEEFYSIPEVIAEIRDKAARERFEALPVTVAMRQPQPWAIKFVNQFSKKTGDYAILSLADIKILALTYELEIEARGSSSHLRTEPQKCVVEGPKSQSKSIDSTNIEGFHDPDGKCEQLTNSSDISSEIPHEDVDIHSSDNSTSNPHDDDTSELSDSLSDEHPTQLSDFASDSKEIGTILWCHLTGLENFLTEYSYVGGYQPTAEDLNVYAILAKEYPQFQPLPRHKRKAFSTYDLPFSPTLPPLHATFPCIRRWSYHISSFSEEERNLFPSGREAEEILRGFVGEVWNNRVILAILD